MPEMNLLVLSLDEDWLLLQIGPIFQEKGLWAMQILDHRPKIK